MAFARHKNPLLPFAPFAILHAFLRRLFLTPVFGDAQNGFQFRAEVGPRRLAVGGL
ncbi:hypothetical protein RAHE111665_03315 [Rariglobus hedericola]